MYLLTTNQVVSAFLKIHSKGRMTKYLEWNMIQCRPCKIRDPYEMRHVFVKNSEIPFAGEGLWAKTDIKVLIN